MIKFTLNREYSVGLTQDEYPSTHGGQTASACLINIRKHLMSKCKKTYKLGRDVITGRFITVKEAIRRPKTTIIHTMKKK